MSADRGDRLGQTIGARYRIDKLIGRGAMADVFRALDIQTSVHVALKILRQSLENDPAARQRFQREAEVQERIRHRNVAALLDVGVTQFDEPYLVVELLRGKSLRGVIKSKSVSSRAAPPRSPGRRCRAWPPSTPPACSTATSSLPTSCSSRHRARSIAWC